MRPLRCPSKSAAALTRLALLLDLPLGKEHFAKEVLGATRESCFTEGDSVTLRDLS
jgi:hypothetical protein